jgi:hypothetical protein
MTVISGVSYEMTPLPFLPAVWDTLATMARYHNGVPARAVNEACPAVTGKLAGSDRGRMTW